eukprot:30923-Pelagococcus_subviridis.AAC.5
MHRRLVRLFLLRDLLLDLLDLRSQVVQRLIVHLVPHRGLALDVAHPVPQVDADLRLGRLELLLRLADRRLSLLHRLRVLLALVYYPLSQLRDRGLLRGDALVRLLDFALAFLFVFDPLRHAAKRSRLQALAQLLRGVPELERHVVELFLIREKRRLVVPRLQLGLLLDELLESRLERELLLHDPGYLEADAAGHLRGLCEARVREGEGGTGGQR